MKLKAWATRLKLKKLNNLSYVCPNAAWITTATIVFFFSKEHVNNSCFEKKVFTLSTTVAPGGISIHGSTTDD